jgi:branched-chain amino acid transport system ATP-binding protein
MLQADTIVARYGAAAPALCGVSLIVNPGEVVALLGANGAGKTTTLRALVGAVPLTGGTVSVEGDPVGGERPQRRLRRGIAMVPEGRGIFAGLSVYENLLVGGYVDTRTCRRRANEMLEMFPQLESRRSISAAMLSGGEQQMLAIGRALMSSPKYLLLDEPSMGLSPAIVKSIGVAIARQAEAGVGVLLVEQNAKMALSVSRRAYVLERGRLVMEGDAHELARDERVQAAYLGWN